MFKSLLLFIGTVLSITLVNVALPVQAQAATLGPSCLSAGCLAANTALKPVELAGSRRGNRVSRGGHRRYGNRGGRRGYGRRGSGPRVYRHNGRRYSNHRGRRYARHHHRNRYRRHHRRYYNDYYGGNDYFFGFGFPIAGYGYDNYYNNRPTYRSGSAWARACARKYRSFNPRTGNYLAYSGKYRRCRL